jgi:hypothetical protein
LPLTAASQTVNNAMAPVNLPRSRPDRRANHAGDQRVDVTIAQRHRLALVHARDGDGSFAHDCLDRNHRPNHIGYHGGMTKK